jgi:hypothetical protein
MSSGEAMAKGIYGFKYLASFTVTFLLATDAHGARAGAHSINILYILSKKGEYVNGR